MELNDTAHDTRARWRADPIAFIEEILIDPETKKPFMLLDAERAFLKHAFATGADGQAAVIRSRSMLVQRSQERQRSLRFT